MDDKKEQALKYQQWLKEQRRLERVLKEESDEECIKTAIEKVHTHDYMNLPRPKPIKIIPIRIPAENAEKHTQPYKNTKYRDNSLREDRQQPKLSNYMGNPEYWGKYWEENKEAIRTERKRRERISSQGNGRYKQELTPEERKEQLRQYYQENKEKIKQHQKNYREKQKDNREAAMEAARLAKQAAVDAHIYGKPSPFRTAITQHGCYVCGEPAPLRLFRNPDTKDYTGCLCVPCYESYTSLNSDANRMFKLREYYLARERANAHHEEEQ